MPQPDNKRSRGKNLGPLQGSQITPQGTSGVYSTGGSSRNVAGSAAPSGIQIGQQARIIDDGSGLYTALQGAFQGVERGVKQFDEWETRVAQKRQNDWETELAEYSRTVSGNPKKMAEWTRLQEYRPHSKTAKRFNTMMADMEGKEYDAYQNDIIHNVTQATSKMDMVTASRYLNDQMSMLDPEDKAFKLFATTLAATNQKLTSISASYDQSNTNLGYKTGMFDLGQALTNSGNVTPGDLANGRASVVGAAYNFFGQDPSRLVIKPDDGSIMYTSDDGAVYNGSFRGGLDDSMINAMRADLGNAAYGSDGQINPRIAKNVEGAISNGRFNSQHTQRGGAAKAGEVPFDLLRNTFINPALDVSAKRGSFVDAISQPQLSGSPDKQRSHSLKVLNGLIDGAVTSTDMTPEQQVDFLTELILVADPENNESQWTDNGFAGQIRDNPDIAEALNKARDQITETNTNIAFSIAEKTSAVTHTSLSTRDMRAARSQGVEAILRRTAGTGTASAPPTLHFITREGPITVTGIDKIKQYQLEHPDAIISGSVQIVDNRLAADRSDDLKNGVWIGPAGASPPEATQRWMKTQAENLRNVKNVEAVVAAVDSGQRGEMQASNAEAAVKTIISKLPVQPLPSDIAGTLQILASPLWPRESINRMSKDVVSNVNGVGLAMQEVLSLSTDQAHAFAYMPSEQLAEAMRSDDPAIREDAIKFATLSRLSSSPETRDLAMYLTGDPKGDSAWYMTKGKTLIDQYRNYHSENPSEGWLKSAKNFDLLPAMTGRATEITNNILDLATSDATTGEAGSLLLALSNPAESKNVDVLVARELMARWNSTIEEDGGNSFLEIAQDVNHPDRIAFQRWMRKSVSRFEGAVALDKIMQDDTYLQHAAEEDAARKSGNPSPEMSDGLFLKSWQNALSVVGPPSNGLMTPRMANTATSTPPDMYGNGTASLTVQQQASVHGIRYFSEVLAGRRESGGSGDLETALSELGIERTGLSAEDSAAFYEAYAFSPQFARDNFVLMVREDDEGITNSKKFDRLNKQLEKFFGASVDYNANDNSSDLTTANFRVNFNFTGDRSGITEQTRMLLDMPMDSSHNPILRFHRVPATATNRTPVVKNPIVWTHQTRGFGS